jgi:hypothetical protein
MEVSGQLHGPTALPMRTRPGIHWIGGWVGPRANLELWRRTNVALAGFRTPAVQPVARRYIDWVIPTLIAPCSPLNVFALRAPVSSWFLAWVILRPWRWRRDIHPKHRLTFSGLHGVLLQKIELFNVSFCFCVEWFIMIENKTLGSTICFN